MACALLGVVKHCLSYTSGRAFTCSVEAMLPSCYAYNPVRHDFMLHSTVLDMAYCSAVQYASWTLSASDWLSRRALPNLQLVNVQC
jgi:hypothetical protein